MAKIVEENGVSILRDDWHIGDIVYQAENQGFQISENQALEIMQMIAHSFDANFGINWETIGIYIDQYMKG